MLADALARCSDRELDTLVRFASSADLPSTVAAHWAALSARERSRRAAIASADPEVAPLPMLAPESVADGAAAANTLLDWYSRTGRTDTRLIGVFAALARGPQQDLRALAEAAFAQVQA